MRDDERKFRGLMGHFYFSVVYGSRAASSRDSVVDWMKTKSVKCDKRGCTKCATVCDPDWVDKLYKLINEGV